MTPAARHQTAIELLDQILDGEPAGLTLTQWGRRARHAGSRDRAAVRDIVFDCLRRRRSLAHRAGEETGRGLVAALVAEDGPALSEIFSGQTYAPEPLSAEEISALDAERETPDAVRLDYPDFLDADLKRSLGERFEPVMLAMKSRAPVDLRVNRQKASVEAAIATLKGDEIGAERIDGLPNGLRITENPRRISGSAAYRDGMVELQDASSQAVALFAGPEAGMKVLDYCAGGGGKALALYDAMRGKGQMVAHDIAMVRMNDLPARAARAGARITVVGPGDAALVAENFDLVFVDAPCSGTGSWRRTPDAKWRMSAEDLARVETVQARILDAASGYVAAGGTLVYATCSVLRSENAAQVEAFLGRDSRFVLDGQLHLAPDSFGDGFFAAKLRR